MYGGTTLRNKGNLFSKIRNKFFGDVWLKFHCMYAIHVAIVLLY